MGYQKVHSHTKTWYAKNDKTVQHNIREISRFAGRWGKRQIKPGKKGEWNRKVQKKDLGNQIEDSNLLADSSDFPKRGKTSCSKKSDEYSTKLDGPGHRVMSITDFQPKFRKIFPPYKPKVYDGHYMIANKETLRKEFKGGVFLSDEHFRICKNEFSKKVDKVKFHSPHRNPRKDAKKKKKLDPREKKYNSQISKARGIVESPFGTLKMKFDCFEEPFNGNVVDFENILYTAAGVYNVEL